MNASSVMNHLLHMPLASQLERQPDYIIGPKHDPYVERWWLHRPSPEDVGTNRDTGSSYLHRINSDDRDLALHDHPWPSTSVILSGTLRELTPNGSRLLGPGSVTQRRAVDAHRLEVVDGPVLSLFITGPWEREWGFYTDRGWVQWQEFLNDNNPDRR